jgi:hypothetical protein
VSTTRCFIASRTCAHALVRLRARHLEDGELLVRRKPVDHLVAGDTFSTSDAVMLATDAAE